MRLKDFSGSLATSEEMGAGGAIPKSALKGLTRPTSLAVCSLATSGDPGPAVVGSKASGEVPKALARASLATAGVLGMAVVVSESCGWRVSAASRGVTSSAEGR